MGKTEGWFSELADGRLEVLLRADGHKLRASGRWSSGRCQITARWTPTPPTTSNARLVAMAATADDVRVRLRSLGQRRRRLRTREEELSDEVTEALREAVDVISVAEASRL